MTVHALKISVFLVLLPALVHAAQVETYTVRLPLGDWEPSVDEVVNAPDDLKHDYARWLGERSSDMKPWREYRFQYYGIRKNGRKIIVLNAFCSAYWDRAPDWRRNLILVKDGGSCLVQAQFDVDSSKIISVIMNGES